MGIVQSMAFTITIWLDAINMGLCIVPADPKSLALMTFSAPRV
jgi:hypothetical protein